MMLRETSGAYNFSFMAVSLRPDLARIVAELFLAERDWNAVKRRVLATNALQCRTTSSAIRMERELRLRLATLTDKQLEILATSAADERAAISWLAAIKHIRFAYDFAADMLRDKLAVHEPVLRYSDYETFVETKAPFHPELARLRPSSKNKLRQILLKMLAEAGLVEPGSTVMAIHRPFLSTTILDTIRSDNPRWLAGFLFPDNELGLGAKGAEGDPKPQMLKLGIGAKGAEGDPKPQMLK